MIKSLIRKTRIVIGSKLVGLGFLTVPDDYMWSFRCRLFENHIKELEAERDTYKNLAERTGKALHWASAVVEQVANCQDVDPNMLAVALIEMQSIFEEGKTDE
jgi:hypothetical protein